MTFAAPEPIASGQAMTIVEVDGQPPGSLEDFVGERSFVVQTGGHWSTVSGNGIRHDDVVKFYQKDLEHDGKDIRVWEIDAEAATGWVARSASAF